MPRQLKFRCPPGRSTDRQRYLPANPLAAVRTFSPTDFADAYETAELIIRCGRDEVRQLNFSESEARTIMTMVILHHCYEATRQNRVASLADLAPTFEPTNFRAMLPQLITAEHDPGCEHGWRMRDGELTSTHPAVCQQAKNFLDTPDDLLLWGLLAAKSAVHRYYEALRRQQIIQRSEELLRHARPRPL